MSPIRVLEVDRLDAAGDGLLGFHVDAPVAGAAIEGHAVPLLGWVLGAREPCQAVEVVAKGRVIRTIPLEPRPDVVKAYPGAPGGESSGFSAMVGALGGPCEFVWTLRAVLAGGGRADFALLRCSRSRLRPVYAPDLQPLMLTSLGRSGTRWLMYLLSRSPAILCHERWPFDFEHRVAQYWMQWLRVLTEPGDSHSDRWQERFMWDLEHVTRMPYDSQALPADTRRWLNGRYWELVCATVLKIIDDFYLTVCDTGGAHDPARYFAEKFLPGNHLPWMFWELYPDAREIFLVRDFRDTLASILSFNEKTGRVGFEREAYASDEDYVGHIRGSAETLWESWQARRDRALLVRYEDLVRSPKRVLKEVFEYLGLELGPAVEAALRPPTHEEELAMGQHRTSGGGEDSIGRWRRDLAPSVQERCQELLADPLRRFGYEP